MLYFERPGRPGAEPLLLLHGFTGSGADFQPFVKTMGTSYQRIVADFPEADRHEGSPESALWVIPQAGTPPCFDPAHRKSFLDCPLPFLS